MAAAIRLFGERGFEATTVDDIAAAADVSPRTFFRYYPAKVDALFGDFEEREERMRAALAGRARDEPLIESIRRLVLEFIGDFLADRELFATRVRLIWAHPVIRAHALEYLARVEDVVAEAVAQELRVDYTDVRPRLVAAVAVGAVRTTSATWAARETQGDPRALADETFELIERGLLSLAPVARNA
jgi:AcrR family transcriptional regulator